MTNYRPITDMWLLARAKSAYYGAYPAGFLHRARALMGVKPTDAILHVCAGQVRRYPFRGFGRHDRTVDIDAKTKPNYRLDVRTSLPLRHTTQRASWAHDVHLPERQLWDGVLIDRPYSEADAAHYAHGAAVLPPLNPLLVFCLRVVPTGCLVGVLDYKWPNPRSKAREVAAVGVTTGRDATMRVFTVWEKL